MENVREVSIAVPTNIHIVEPNLINSELLCSPDTKHTSAVQATNMHSLPQEYGEPFENVPRFCPLLKPEVETRDAEPVILMQRKGRPCRVRFSTWGSMASSVPA